METEKNAFVINDDLKFSASKALCLKESSHAAMSEADVFSTLSHAPVPFWQIAY